MSGLIETKTRLNSTKSTQKVIKAMELVASSKIKKAKDKAVAIDFYYDTTMDAMSHLSQYSVVEQTLKPKKAKDCTLVIAITSDMGLCGAYNGNVIKELSSVTKNANESKVIVIGNKGINKLKYENIEALAEFGNYGSINEFDLAEQITNIVVDEHENLNINEIKLIYTKYINPIIQEVETIDLLDLKIPERKSSAVLLVEPNEDIIFKQLLHQYILSVVYSGVLQSFASEHSYRRNSMETANKNSLELIEELDLEMNRIRQSMITQEISEIIGGSEALKD